MAASSSSSSSFLTSTFFPRSPTTSFLLQPRSLPSLLPLSKSSSLRGDRTSFSAPPRAVLSFLRRTSVSTLPSPSAIDPSRKCADDTTDSSSSFLDAILVVCASVALSLSLFLADVDSAAAFVVTTPRKLQADELATVRLFQENTPSVVYITNLAVKQDAFTLDVLEVPQGSGSGFVWDKNGHIVTNYHVIRGASDLKSVPSTPSLILLSPVSLLDISDSLASLGASLLLLSVLVTLADQTSYDAKVVGFDQDKDVAVLSVEAPLDKLRPIPVGVSADLLVGQKVYAIGNPVSMIN
ncbi:unnamed protein product [Linum tenue]|uniref:Protease Do-like 1, chloroplastic n=1 Tax=Linum tenue TaxID=586396 RepID=A0AAV0NBX5_9ROSI|nr:unnamed protein product [Linum tenue]